MLSVFQFYLVVNCVNNTGNKEACTSLLPVTSWLKFHFILTKEFVSVPI